MLQSRGLGRGHLGVLLTPPSLPLLTTLNLPNTGLRFLFPARRPPRGRALCPHSALERARRALGVRRGRVDHENGCYLLSQSARHAGSRRVRGQEPPGSPPRHAGLGEEARAPRGGPAPEARPAARPCARIGLGSKLGLSVSDRGDLIPPPQPGGSSPGTPAPGSHGATFSVTHCPWEREGSTPRGTCGPGPGRQAAPRGGGLTQGWLRCLVPALGSRVGDEPADLFPSETSGTLLPLWALAESPVAGGVAAFSEPNLLRKSGYRSLPLALMGISLQSLSNWRGSRRHFPGVRARRRGTPRGPGGKRGGCWGPRRAFPWAGVRGPRR